MEDKPIGPSGMTKYGGVHWMVAYIPMSGRIPLRTDGSNYSNDQYAIYNEADTSEIHVADVTIVENFVKACRCEAEDFEKWKHAIHRDMKLNPNARHHGDDFLKTVKLHDEPIVNPELCRMLQNGTLVMVIEITKYLFVIHIGNDFTKVFRPKLKNCRDSGRCTFAVTDKAFCAQRASRCRTCFGDDVGMAICDNCIATCHRGHDTYIVVKSDEKSRYVVPKTLMYCDCGYKLPCKLL